MPFTSREYIDRFIRTHRLRDISFCIDKNILDILGLTENDVLAPADPEEHITYINPKNEGQNASFIDHHAPDEGVYFHLPYGHLHFYREEGLIILEEKLPKQDAIYTTFGLTKNHMLNDVEKQKLLQKVQAGFTQPSMGE